MKKEKVEIKGFIETSFLDWKGKIASVIFLPRCNFRCPFCHNRTLVLEPNKYETIPLELILKKLKTLSGWVDGVCITGGEPTMHPFLGTIIDKIHDLGFGVKLDTNGSHPDVLLSMINNKKIEYVAMDIKAPLSKEKYRLSAGVDVDISKIKESINIIIDSGIDHEFRTTIVPDLHHLDDIIDIVSFIKKAKRYTLQNFNPGEEVMDPLFAKKSPFSPDDFSKIQKKVEKVWKNLKGQEPALIPALLKSARAV